MRGLAIVVVAGCGFRGPMSLAGDDQIQHDAPIVDVAVADIALADVVSGDVPAMPDAAPDTAIDAMSTTGCAISSFNCNGAAMAVQCNGHCWLSCSEAINQPAAKARCLAQGGALAYTDNQSDDTCVSNTIFGQNVASWIGYEQASGQLFPNVGWSFPNNDPWVNWASGQPIDADLVEDDQQDCAYESTQGKWHSADCNGDVYKWSCRF